MTPNTAVIKRMFNILTTRTLVRRWNELIFFLSRF